MFKRFDKHFITFSVTILIFATVSSKTRVHFIDVVHWASNTIGQIKRIPIEDQSVLSETQELRESGEENDEAVEFLRNLPYAEESETVRSERTHDKIIKDHDMKLRHFLFSKSEDMSDSCLDNTVCENVPDYPEKEINYFLQREGWKYKEYFSFPEFNETIEIGPRYNINERDFEEKGLCLSYSRILSPQKGVETTSGKVKYIINQKSTNYTQIFAVEMCSSPNSECEFYNEYTIPYKTICKQKYIVKRLLAFDSINKEMSPDEFKIPACCQCVYIEPKEK